MPSDFSVYADLEITPSSITKSIRDIERTLATSKLNFSIDTKSMSAPLGVIKRDVSQLSKSLEAANARVVAFGASTVILYKIQDAFRALITSVIDVEKQLQDVNVIFNLSDSGVKKFGSDLFKIARDTGQSFGTVADAAKEFSRQGLGVIETTKRTRDAMILLRQSGLDAESSVTKLTAIMNIYSDQLLDTTQAINKLSNVDASFAVSTGDLVEAFSRSASAAKEAGVSFDEFSALVTVAQQNTARGGAVIGNAFKTIFARLKSQDTINAMKQLGVSYQDANGNLLDGIELLKQYAVRYKELKGMGNEIGAAKLSEKLGGKLQLNILLATTKGMIGAQNEYNRALEISKTATDEAIQRNIKLNQTISAIGNQTKQYATEISSLMGDISFAPIMKTGLQGINTKILEPILNSLKGGEDQGFSIGKAIVSGIGNFVTGPGAILLGGVLVKILAKTGMWIAGATKDMLGMNTAANKQAEVQQAISQLLGKNAELYGRISSSALSQVDKERLITQELRAQVAERMKMESMTAGFAASAVKSGVFVNPKSGKLSYRNFASGYDPLSQESSDIYNGVGGSKSGDIPVRINKFHFANGTTGSAIANSGEWLVRNYNGSGSDAIFNRDMVGKMGMPKNAISLKNGNFAKGMLPGQGFSPELEQFLKGLLVTKALEDKIRTEMYRSMEAIETKKLGAGIAYGGEIKPGFEGTYELEGKRFQSIKTALQGEVSPKRLEQLGKILYGSPTIMGSELFKGGEQPMKIRDEMIGKRPKPLSIVSSDKRMAGITSAEERMGINFEKFTDKDIERMTGIKPADRVSAINQLRKEANVSPFEGRGYNMFEKPQIARLRQMAETPMKEEQFVKNAQMYLTQGKSFAQSLSIASKGLKDLSGGQEEAKRILESNIRSLSDFSRSIDQTSRDVKTKFKLEKISQKISSGKVLSKDEYSTLKKTMSEKLLREEFGGMTISAVSKDKELRKIYLQKMRQTMGEFKPVQAPVGPLTKQAPSLWSAFTSPFAYFGQRREYNEAAMARAQKQMDYYGANVTTRKNIFNRGGYVLDENGERIVGGVNSKKQVAARRRLMKGPSNYGIATTIMAPMAMDMAAGFIEQKSGPSMITGALQGGAMGLAMGSLFGPWGMAGGTVVGGLIGAFANMKNAAEETAKALNESAKKMQEGLIPLENLTKTEADIEEAISSGFAEKRNKLMYQREEIISGLSPERKARLAELEKGNRTKQEAARIIFEEEKQKTRKEAARNIFGMMDKKSFLDMFKRGNEEDLSRNVSALSFQEAGGLSKEEILKREKELGDLSKQILYSKGAIQNYKTGPRLTSGSSPLGGSYVIGPDNINDTRGKGGRFGYSPISEKQRWNTIVEKVAKEINISEDQKKEFLNKENADYDALLRLIREKRKAYKSIIESAKTDELEKRIDDQKRVISLSKEINDFLASKRIQLSVDQYQEQLNQLKRSAELKYSQPFMSEAKFSALNTKYGKQELEQSISLSRRGSTLEKFKNIDEILSSIGVTGATSKDIEAAKGIITKGVEMGQLPSEILKQIAQSISGASETNSEAIKKLIESNFVRENSLATKRESVTVGTDVIFGRKQLSEGEVSDILFGKNKMLEKTASEIQKIIPVAKQEDILGILNDKANDSIDKIFSAISERFPEKINLQAFQEAMSSYEEYDKAILNEADFKRKSYDITRSLADAEANLATARAKVDLSTSNLISKESSRNDIRGIRNEAILSTRRQRLESALKYLPEQARIRYSNALETDTSAYEIDKMKSQSLQQARQQALGMLNTRMVGLPSGINAVRYAGIQTDFSKEVSGAKSTEDIINAQKTLLDNLKGMGLKGDDYYNSVSKTTSALEDQNEVLKAQIEAIQQRTEETIRSQEEERKRSLTLKAGFQQAFVELETESKDIAGLGKTMVDSTYGGINTMFDKLVQGAKPIDALLGGLLDISEGIRKKVTGMMVAGVMSGIGLDQGYAQEGLSKQLMPTMGLDNTSLVLFNSSVSAATTSLAAFSAALTAATTTASSASVASSISVPTISAGTSDAGTFNGGGVIKKYAKGGRVFGIGGIDKNPSMLSNNEYVLNSRAAKSIGYSNLDKINKYANGGSVGFSGSTEDLSFKYPGKLGKGEYNPGALPGNMSMKFWRGNSPTAKEYWSDEAEAFAKHKEKIAEKAARKQELIGLGVNTALSIVGAVAMSAGQKYFSKDAIAQRKINAYNKKWGLDAGTKMSSSEFTKQYGAGLQNDWNSLTRNYPSEAAKYSGFEDFANTAYYSDARHLKSSGGIIRKYANGGSVAPFLANGGNVDWGQNGVDKVPTWLTKGEYVIKKPVVDRIGVGALNKLNNNSYATGGLVDSTNKNQQNSLINKATSQSNNTVNVNINISGGGTTTQTSGAAEKKSESSGLTIDSSELATKIKAVCLETIAKQQRVGGSLSK